MSRATTSDSGEASALGRACTGAVSRAKAARLADARASCVPRVRIMGSGGGGGGCGTREGEGPMGWEEDGQGIGRTSL